VVSRTPLSESASFWAQGGLAAALEPGDSPERHAEDTIAAGRGLCRPSAVRVLVEEAPSAVRELQARGVVFDLDHEGRLALGLEGGHASRRIVHAGGSQTGHEVTSKLAAMVAIEDRIEAMERTSAVSLWSDDERCHGLIADSGPVAAAPSGAAPPTRGGRSERGRCWRAPPAPTSPTSSSASSTPPPWRSPAVATTGC
jgi:L-aspartate oxidase